jgi:hypothetical protein
MRLSPITTLWAETANMSGHNTFCKARDSGGAFLPDKKLFVVGSSYLATRASAKTAETILVEKGSEYTTALKDVKAGRFSKNTIVVFDRSTDPERALSKVDNSITKVHLLYNFPGTLEEARLIHRDKSQDVLAAYMDSFNELSAQVDRLGGVKIRPQEGKKAAEWLANYIAGTSDNDLVLILSHVEPDEVLLKSPDGDLIPYADGIYPLVDGTTYNLSQNTKSRSLVWTLGCDTWDALSEGRISTSGPNLAISRPIEYHESVDLAKLIVQSRGTVRSTISRLQGVNFGRLPPNVPKKLVPAHFSPARPHQPLQVIVENLSGPNIVTGTLIGVA